MGRITLNTNVTALLVNRRLASSTEALQETFTRLSSGLRINKAGDDAAGLSISESLKVDARVFSQGVRNISDGASLISIAEGALGELKNINIRLRELATQASNGTLSLTQRRALDEEADALTDEYNRIIRSTEFNGRALFNPANGDLRIQAGIGADAGLILSLAGQLADNIGTGQLGDAATIATGFSNPEDVILEDFNNDGHLDIVSGLVSQSRGVIRLGNGDGTFQASQYFFIDTPSRAVVAGDLNGDGFLDIVTNSHATSNLSVLYGNGDGTFTAASNFDAGSATYDIGLADFNSDGVLDIVATSYTDNTINILLNNGNGTFGAVTTFTADTTPTALVTGDFNGDGRIDVSVTGYNTGNITTLFGSGNGEFTIGTVHTGIPNRVNDGAFATADLNDDGILDLIGGDLASGSNTFVLIGNGDGTFSQTQTFSGTGRVQGLAIGDVNGDGIPDFAFSTSDTPRIALYLGNGDGTFALGDESSIPQAATGLAIGDVNGDGVNDFVSSSNSSVNSLSIALAETKKSTIIGQLNLNSRETALASLSIIEENFNHIVLELGALGAMQSRLEVAANNLQVARENYSAAAAQITDADIAEEAAQLVRKQILQNAASSLLGQANIQPQLALRLLGSV